MKKKSAMSELMEYAGKHKYLTYLSFALSGISSLAALVPYYFIWKIIKEAVECYPDFSRVKDIAANGRYAVISAVAAMLIYFAALLCSHLSAFRVQRNIRTKAMEHIVSLPVGFMDDMGSGKVRKIVNDCSSATETYLAHNWPDKAGMMFTPIGLAVLLFAFDYKLGLLCLVPVAAALIFMSGMMGKNMQEKMKEYQDALAVMSNEAVEYVRGVPVIKTFGQSIFSFKRFKKTIDDYSEWAIAYTKMLTRPMLAFITAINAVFAVIIAAGIVISSDGITNTELLNLMFYIIITPIITVTLNKVAYAGENSMLVADSLERIHSIMDLKPLPESSSPKTPADNSIELNNVSFSYTDSERKALDGLSISVGAGEHIALVGPSGGGKSTTASVITRFYDVQNGEVKIGGVNVKDISKEKLMDTVAFVFQDSGLLKMSVYDNVRMARPNASRDNVLKALHDAQCDDIIAKLPNGIDTVIGAKGVYVSGGEQQRINIARVMLKNAPVLILDEATAFADPDNEAKVQAAFSKLGEGKTVIMIAHRLSTVTNADKIYVIKDGKAAESGKHNDLVEQNGIYSRMWKEYQSSAEWKVGQV